jgi:hypothetical protein
MLKNKAVQKANQQHNDMNSVITGYITFIFISHSMFPAASELANLHCVKQVLWLMTNFSIVPYAEMPSTLSVSSA